MIAFAKTRQGARAPRKIGAAYELFAAERRSIPVGGAKAVPTGIVIDFSRELTQRSDPYGSALCATRADYAGIVIAHHCYGAEAQILCAGDGEISVWIRNNYDSTLEIVEGASIATLVILRGAKADLIEVKEIPAIGEEWRIQL